MISDLSLEAASGEALLVQGPNGVGKSTLLRALAGLLPLEAGTVRLEDRPADIADVPLTNLMHYLGHENAMKPTQSVAENLAFWKRFAGQPHLDVDEALDMVGLDGLQAVPFAHLSTGQRRRVAIARLLVSWRPVWLLDEPTAGLDAASSEQFEALMGAHLEDDGIIIATTHVPLRLDSARAMMLGGVSA